MVEELEQRNVMKLLSTTESPELVIKSWVYHTTV